MSTDRPSLRAPGYVAGSLDCKSTADDGVESQQGKVSAPRTRRRRSQAERRAQIARATYDLVGKHGVRDTSVALIAEAVGVTPQALYAHFSSRHEMLVAALDCYYQQAKLPEECLSSSNILEGLRELLYRHVETKGTDLMSFASPHFEFVVAPRDTELPSLFGEVQLRVLESIAELIEEGQRQGSIRKDLDPMIGAWRTAAFAWTEEIALLIGRNEYIEKGYSRDLVDLLIDDMAPRVGGQ